jgi:hypothetical protein
MDDPTIIKTVRFLDHFCTLYCTYYKFSPNLTFLGLKFKTSLKEASLKKAKVPVCRCWLNLAHDKQFTFKFQINAKKALDFATQNKH